MATPVSFTVKSPEAGTEILVISFDAGASGAVGAFDPSTRRKEFRQTLPVVRTGVGAYDVFLKERWIDLLWYVANCNGPVSASAGKTAQLVSDTLTAAIPKVSLVFVNAAGAAADPASGDQVYITLALKKSRPL